MAKSKLRGGWQGYADRGKGVRGKWIIFGGFLGVAFFRIAKSQNATDLKSRQRATESTSDGGKVLM